MEHNDLKIPNHLGIIVDGNGRWATSRGKSRSEGHKAGAKNIDKVIELVFNRGIKYLSLFVFSTENFKRSKEEVDYLMNLVGIKFKSDFKKLKEKNIKVLISGSRENLSNKILKILDEVQEDTRNNTGNVLNFCLNYGGQLEIIDAVKKIHHDAINNIINIEEINEETFSNYLYHNLPPLDFVIRTSGEMRISNFMLWQLSYAELYFPKVLFPNFNEEDLEDAIFAYNKRERRFGGNWWKPEFLVLL